MVCSTVNVKSISYYRMAGNFHGYKLFVKQTKTQVPEIVAILIFMVSGFGTHALASCMAKS